MVRRFGLRELSWILFSATPVGQLVLSRTPVPLLTFSLRFRKQIDGAFKNKEVFICDAASNGLCKDHLNWNQ